MNIFNKPLFIALLLFLVVPMGSIAQKIYVSGGISTIWGGSVWIDIAKLDQGWFEFNHQTLDVEYEKRLLGSFNVLTGVSFFNSGYSQPDRSYGSESDFKAVYAAVPLMIRWNAGNKNMAFIDLGLVPFYLLNARLKETVTRYGDDYVVEGNITKYSNRIYFGSKLQILIPINRLVFGFYFFIPVKGQSTLKNLQDHWGLNAQESTYLIANGFSDFTIIGLKAGFRVR